MNGVEKIEKKPEPPDHLSPKYRILSRNFMIRTWWSALIGVDLVDQSINDLSHRWWRSLCTKQREWWGYDSVPELWRLWVQPRRGISFLTDMMIGALKFQALLVPSFIWWFIALAPDDWHRQLAVTFQWQNCKEIPNFLKLEWMTCLDLFIPS